MKFSVNRQGFLKNLVDVQRAIPSKTTIPILTGIKLVASEEGLTLTGSDSEVSWTVNCNSSSSKYSYQSKTKNYN